MLSVRPSVEGEFRTAKEAGLCVAGPSKMTGAGRGSILWRPRGLSGRTTAEREVGMAIAAARAVEDRASILLDSPSRLGASKMSKIWMSRGASSPDASDAADAVPIERIASCISGLKHRAEAALGQTRRICDTQAMLMYETCV